MEHSIGTWSTNVGSFSCLNTPMTYCRTWKLRHDRLYGNLIFRLFPASTQIHKHDDHECLWKKFVKGHLYKQKKLYRQNSWHFPCLCSFKLQKWLSVTFDWYFSECYRILTVKMQNICNLIGWNSVHISNIFTYYRVNINGMWNARKESGI